jgi:hypothetical protein
MNQTDKILNALETRAGWIPMPDLAMAASPSGQGYGLAVHSRIADCRKILAPSGRTVLNRRERIEGHTVSFYRIAPL